MVNTQHAAIGRLTRVRAWALLGALGIATVLWAQSLWAQSGPLEDLAKFPHSSLKVLHGKKKKDPRQLQVWVADTPARQEQGLMFTQALPQGQGMLFLQAKPKKMSMWMKNTYIELDMVFIGEKGAIDQIVAHAKPLSLDKINSDKTVTAVLEIGGGEAERLGLNVGDRVNWTPPESP